MFPPISNEFTAPSWICLNLFLYWKMEIMATAAASMDKAEMYQVGLVLIIFGPVNSLVCAYTSSNALIVTTSDASIFFSSQKGKKSVANMTNATNNRNMD